MKTSLTILIFSLGFIQLSAQSYDTLTNKTVIQLTKIGLPPQTIVNKIQTSITAFDVSVNGLLNLQANGVSGDVINEMIKRSDRANSQAGKEVNNSNPNTTHRPGIYYFNMKNSNPLKRVDPTVISTNTSGGFGIALAQAYTYGVAQGKVKSNLSGARSHLQIGEANPVFYFYFENNANPGADSWFFATATSPNEFVLVKLKERRDSREMAVGTYNAYGHTSGIANKVKVAFDYMEMTEGVYKVTFKQPLEQGEYCFLYASETPSRYANNKVFDFGIQNGQ